MNSAKAQPDNGFSPTAISSAVVLACGAVGISPPVQGQGQDGMILEEVIITAQKRDQSLQDVPIAVSVLGDQDLQNLGITDLEDYVQMFPNVSYISLGPGSGDIYIRGISGGGASPLGATPNVAVYLDEQPITAVNQYLNPHVYDIAQIETLAGPQGTLFGANAQSGAIRMISTKPDATEFSAGIDLEGNSVEKGDVGYLAEGFVNIPISNNAALRLVGYYKKDPGYIDNVYSAHTFSNANIRAGLTDPDLIAIAQDITIDNADFSEDDFNEATTIGGRASLRVDLGDNWTVTASAIRQELESEGVWDHDPRSQGDLEVARYLEDSVDDDWTQLSLVVQGQIAGMTLTYAGSDLDRDFEQEADNSLYSDYYVSGGFVQRYYSCYVSYFGECVDPRGRYENHSKYERTNHEIRLASAADKRFRWLVGVFYEDAEHSFDLEWHILGLAEISPNFDDDGLTQWPNAAIDAPDVYWTTDQKRSNEETAYFGQVQFDLTDQLTASVSARYFEYDSHLKGFSGTIWYPTCCWQRPPFNTDLVTDDEDTVYRGNIQYSFTDDIMVYFTYAEGYRPGGLNRVFDTVIGGTYEPDFVESWEIGAKTTLLDGRLRLNGAAYLQEWDDFQLSRFDLEVSPLTLTDNVGTAESNGVEGDFTLLITGDWELTGAVSYIDATITEDYWVDKSMEGITEPDAEEGRELPRVPEWKWNLGTRYSFDVAGIPSFVTATYIYTGESYNQLFSSDSDQSPRVKQDDYAVLNLAAGIDQESWGLEVFLRNATDERGEVFVNSASSELRVTTNRPRTVGVRTRFRF